MEGPKSSSILSPVNMYHYKNLADSQIKHPASNIIFPCNNFPSNIVQGPPPNSPPVELHCQKQRYIPYRGPQNANSLTIEVKSIDTDLVSNLNWDNSNTLKSNPVLRNCRTHIDSTFESRPGHHQRERYVP